MRAPRSWFGKLSLIAIASAVASATATAISTVIMAERSSPSSIVPKASGRRPSGGSESDEEGKKLPSDGKSEEGKKGFSGKLSDYMKFVTDLREYLPDISLPKPSPVLDSFSMEGVVRHIQAGKAKKIIVMTGAGISTSAGIPDFRSPGTGLYDNLAEYNLPHPQAIFEIGYFNKNPEPFFKLAQGLFPGKLKPTPCHYFIRLLHEKGMLLRTYTQNIDALEHIAGMPADKVIEAHGTFRQGHCLKCREEYSLDWIRAKIMDTLVPRCEKCDNVVKPDIVFFGEALPMKFYTLVPQDFNDCDMLIVMGTSLVVQPFASLVDKVEARVPRMLINLDKAGQGDFLTKMMGLGGGLQYDDENNYRDVFWSGTCDDGAQKMADLLGWGDELKDMIKREWAKIDAQSTSAVDRRASENKEEKHESASKI